MHIAEDLLHDLHSFLGAWIGQRTERVKNPCSPFEHVLLTFIVKPDEFGNNSQGKKASKVRNSIELSTLHETFDMSCCCDFDAAANLFERVWQQRRDEDLAHLEMRGIIRHDHISRHAFVQYRIECHATPG